MKTSNLTQRKYRSKELKQEREVFVRED